MLDIGVVRSRLQVASERFADEVVKLWEEAVRAQGGRARAEAQRAVDLTADPRPWDFPLRPANTNGSVLLDRFVPLLRPSMLQTLGPELVVAMLMFGVVTDRTALWRGQR